MLAFPELKAPVRLVSKNAVAAQPVAVPLSGPETAAEHQAGVRSGHTWCVQSTLAPESRHLAAALDGADHEDARVGESGGRDGLGRASWCPPGIAPVDCQETAAVRAFVRDRPEEDTAGASRAGRTAADSAKAEAQTT